MKKKQQIEYRFISSGHNKEKTRSGGKAIR